MTKRRVVRLAFTGVMLVSLTACGKNKAVDESAESAGITNQINKLTALSSKQDNTLLDWWNGDWYGWWMMTSGSGYYEGTDGQCWDICGTIDIGSDYTGTVELWDEDYTRDEAMVFANVTLSEYGTGEYGTLYSEDGWFTNMALKHADWIVDPGLMEEENVICIDGWFEDGDDSYKYEIYLRPWGTLWDDVSENAWPYYYTDWYLPLVEAGKAMPDSFEADATDTESTDIAQTISEVQVVDNDDYGLSNADATGMATLEQMQQVYAMLLDWQSEHDYQEVRSVMGSDGVPWKDSDSTWSNEKHSYKWKNEEGSFLYISFQVEDGKEIYYSCTYSSDVRAE